MFLTEINIVLQSLASDGLTWLMRQITTTGNYQFVIGMVIAVMLGVSLRKGFLLFQIIALTAVVSEIAKQFFGLPRPFFVDSRVLCLEPGWDIATPFRAMGGNSFLALPVPEVINVYRLKNLSFGFPSGHVSGAIAMWGGLAAVFRSRILAWLAPFAIMLIAFTRMYLGVHFLADVIGGALLGGSLLFFAWRLIGSDSGRERFFAAAMTRVSSFLPGILYFFFLFVLPLLLALFSLLSAKFAGFYIGLNAAFTLALRSGLPQDTGSLTMRLLRVLLGGLLFWLLSLALRLVLALIPAAAGSAWGIFLAAGLGTFLTLWGGLQLFLRLGLYHKVNPAPVK
ncbi:MAG: phosphatase PAP2 family protein [Chrysiogenia bacterium]